MSGDTVQDVPAIPPVFANKYNIYVNRTSKEISKSRTTWLRECGQVRVFSHEGVFDSFVFCGGYRLLRNSFP